MIKAGSLFYAIVISVIIAIISSSLILFSYLTHIEFENAEINQRLQLNADSGLNLLLSQQSLVAMDETLTMDLFGLGIDSIQLTRRSWGALEVVISKAVFKNTSFLRVAQVGCVQDSTKIYSLYLSDEDKPLAVCGETNIKGTVFLPKSGVTKAFIEGQNFKGDKLIDGAIFQSGKKIPEFSKEIVENIQSVFSARQISLNDSVVSISDDLFVDSSRNSFLNKTLVFLSQTTLRISGGSYTGNIVVISDKQITVSADAQLSGVMLFAPKVILEKGFRGDLQIFATDSVIVGKDVTMEYPSVIGLVRNDRSPDIAAIILNENDTLAGSMFAYKNTGELIKQSGIILLENSFVYGQLFTNGFADVRGTIYGSLMCTKIMLKTPSAVYVNHLLNVVVDRTKLSKHFVGIGLVDVAAVKKVVKWED